MTSRDREMVHITKNAQDEYYSTSKIFGVLVLVRPQLEHPPMESERLEFSLLLLLGRLVVLHVLTRITSTPAPVKPTRICKVQIAKPDQGTSRGISTIRDSHPVRGRLDEASSVCGLVFSIVGVYAWYSMSLDANTLWHNDVGLANEETGSQPVSPKGSEIETSLIVPYTVELVGKDSIPRVD